MPAPSLLVAQAMAAEWWSALARRLPLPKKVPPIQVIRHKIKPLSRPIASRVLAGVFVLRWKLAMIRRMDSRFLRTYTTSYTPTTFTPIHNKSAYFHTKQGLTTTQQHVLAYLHTDSGRHKHWRDT